MIEGLTSFRRQRRRTRAPRRRSRRRTRGFAVLGVLGLVVAGVLAAGALTKSSMLRISRVSVAGCERESAGALRTLAEPLVGRPILLADIEALRAAIEQRPAVRSATVARRLPDLLEIRVTERAPVARLEVSGKLRLVDAEGVVFAHGDDPGTLRSLPWLRGPSLVEPERSHLAEAGRLGLRALEAYASVTGRPAPAGTIVDVSHDERIALRPGAAGATLWLDRRQPERNLARLLRFRPRYQKLARADVIDLRFPDRLTVVRPADATEGR